MELLTKLIERLNYIPDDRLDEYLEGKVLIKPEYDSSVGPSTVKSRYQEALEKTRMERKKDNTRVKRGYRL
jgi:hypothetical protein